jgi:hypothetical protein
MSNLKLVLYSWVVVYKQLTGTFQQSVGHMANMGDNFVIFGSFVCVLIQLLFGIFGLMLL